MNLEIMESKLISLNNLIAEFTDRSGAADRPRIKKYLIDILRKNHELNIDMSSIRSLSPSFAYEIFGKLIDEFRENVVEYIHFTNDERQLSDRIKAAFDRRKLILKKTA